MRYTINAGETTGPFAHFWQSTGFMPADLLLGAEMRQTLQYIGGVPHGGITHNRIHYLLNLVGGEDLLGENPRYDWSRLDAGIDVLVENRMKPFFELMGNPSEAWSDFHAPAQLHAWKRLVTNLALHLMERYGTDEVESWYFETWNEPDTGWWHQFPKDVASFCKYYDACSEGLLAANPNLTFGGAGSCAGLTPWLKAFLAHLDTGTNAFTGEQGQRVDFISVHEKGASPTAEDINPNSMTIVDHEALIVEYIRAHHPRLADVPYMNNECDPQVGWRDVHTWHAKPYYAAFIAKMISQHQRRLVDEMGVPYVILSNDNGFTGVWGNRTHLARQGKKDQLERGEFALIKKPALNVMTMLALLGDAQVAVDGQGDVADDLGVIATRRGDDQIAVLVYHSRDRIMSSGCETVLVDLTGLPFAAASLVHYRIDEAHGNPFGVWEAQFGNPALPRHDTPESIAAMRAVQELEALDAPREVALPGGTLSLTFDLPLHTVSLILLTAKPAEAPEAVVGLTAEVYPGMFPETQEDVMLLWEPLDSRALHTYEVLHATAPEGPFERINTQDLLCGAFLHARPKGQAGHYRVRAVDYWGRPGMATEAMAI